MMAMLAGALRGTIELVERACIACVCMEEIRGTGTCSARANTEKTLFESLDLSTLGLLAVIGVVVIAMRVHTLLPARHDEDGPRPTRGDVPDEY